MGFQGSSTNPTGLSLQPLNLDFAKEAQGAGNKLKSEHRPGTDKGLNTDTCGVGHRDTTGKFVETMPSSQLPARLLYHCCPC